MLHRTLRPPLDLRLRPARGVGRRDGAGRRTRAPSGPSSTPRSIPRIPTRRTARATSCWSAASTRRAASRISTWSPRRGRTSSSRRSTPCGAGSSRRPCATASPSRSPLNAGVRFRMPGREARRSFRARSSATSPSSPADASGAKTAPDGFPDPEGQGPGAARGGPARRAALRAAADDDGQGGGGVADGPQDSRLSAAGGGPGARDRGAASRSSRRSGPTGRTGVWILRFSVDGADAGGGQFWLAKDPANFPFAIPVL